MGLENWLFGGEKKNTDGAEHMAIPQGTGELAGEDQDGVNMPAQLLRLEEQLKRAKEDADAGRDPEIPIPELIEKIENIRAQMPYGQENK